jgi:hypothetical protein
MSQATERIARRKAVNYREVVTPKPEILPACRNCTNFRCDHDDRMNFKNQLTLRRVNLRCDLNLFPVHLNDVCDRHAFQRTNRSDR